jgi:hypothetical protein
MKTLCITAYPYATVEGRIVVPDEVTRKEFLEYVSEHFDEIEFDDAQLDYAGTCFDVYED